MGNLGWTEILVILVIALIIFGPRKLPELGKSLGQSLAQFRKASDDFKATWTAEVETERQKLEAPPRIEPAADTTARAYQEGENDFLPSITPVDEMPATVSRDDSITKQAKSDWM